MKFSALVLLALDLIRGRFGSAIRVNSGRRCVAHNIFSGGAVNSRHIQAEAADISAADYEKLREASIEVCNYLGLKILPYDKEKFLHIQEK